MDDDAGVVVVLIDNCSKRTGMERLPASTVDSLYAKSAVVVDGDVVGCVTDGAIKWVVGLEWCLAAAAPPRKLLRQFRKERVGVVERKANCDGWEGFRDACAAGAPITILSISSDKTNRRIKSWLVANLLLLLLLLRPPVSQLPLIRGDATHAIILEKRSIYLSRAGIDGFGCTVRWLRCREYLIKVLRIRVSCCLSWCLLSAARLLTCGKITTKQLLDDPVQYSTVQ